MTGKHSEPKRKSQKILMTADAVGGVWQYSVDLITGLLGYGAQILLATMGPPPSEQQKRQLASIEGVTVAQSEFALEWMPGAWNDVDAAGGWLRDLASDFGADLIHLNGYTHAALPWRKPVVITAHSCVYSWWRAVHNSAAPDDEWLEYKRRVTEGLASSSAVICPSSYMAAALEREYGFPRNRSQVIHNFSRAPQGESRNKLDFILACGRLWDQAKNLALLDQIAPEVKWGVHVAGGNRGPDQSAAAAQSVRLLGALPHAELLRQMEEAAIFAHPALYEPFGLSVLEAARRRCCLVLSDIPSLRELWQDAAVFADPRDPAQWTWQLNRLIDRPLERQSLAQLASSRAATFRTHAAMNKYWNVYSSLLVSDQTAHNGHQPPCALPNAPGEKETAA